MNRKFRLIILTAIFAFFPIIVNAEELFDSTEIEVTCDGIFTPEALEIIRTAIKLV